MRIADQKEERAGDAGADDAAQVPELGQLLLDGRRGDDDADGKGEHDRRMTQRKEEADAERPLALLQHESHRVVDRRDVIGIERVAQPEHVGDETEPDQRRMARGIVEIESPAQHVQQGDDAVQPGQPPPLGGGERRRAAARAEKVRAGEATARYSTMARSIVRDRQRSATRSRLRRGVTAWSSPAMSTWYLAPSTRSSVSTRSARA